MTRELALPSGTWARRGLALLAGLCIAAGMPPWGWWPLTIIGVGLWAAVSDSERWRTRAMIGAIASWGWFVPSTLWMVKFTPLGWPVGVIVWFGALGALTGALLPPDGRRFMALPAMLILSEWLRWHAPFGGVPLSMLAMTQGAGPLLPAARVGGSLLVSGCVAFLGAGLAAAAFGLRRLGSLMVAGVLLFAIGGVFAPQGEVISEIDVAAVQGGGPQGTRASSTDAALVFQRHLETAAALQPGPDLVVWPENVVNVSVFRGSQQYLAVSQLAARLEATVVVGVVEDAPGNPKGFLNRAIVFGPDGDEVGSYDKVRRVPFGEYVPMRALLGPIAGNRLPQRDAQPGSETGAIDSPAGRLGIAISWEVFFPRRTRAATRDGAEILLNPTNGSSYWLTQVQSQQVASTALRAVENGRWVVQAAPTGFSEIVSPTGEVFGRTAISEAAVVRHTAELRSGQTIATATGDLIPLLVAGLALTVIWVPLLRPRRHYRHGL